MSNSIFFKLPCSKCRHYDFGNTVTIYCRYARSMMSKKPLVNPFNEMNKEGLELVLISDLLRAGVCAAQDINR